MKKVIYGILSITFFAILFVAACQFELFPQSFQIEYYVQGVGGAIEGSAVQSIQAGKDAKQVEAIPNDGYIFIEWSDGVKTAERIDTSISSDMTIYAKFGVELIEVDYKTSNGNGYIQGLTNQTVRYGQNATEVVAVPYEGYRFVIWSDGVATAKREDKNITSDIIVYAEFVPQDIEVKYKAEPNGYIQGVHYQLVERGGNASKVMAVANTGYKFVGWSDGVSTETRTDTNVTSPINVTAKFEKQDITIKYQAEANGYIDGETEQDLFYGDNAKQVTAVADYGYKFVGWSDGVKTAERQDLNLKNDLAVSAKFALIEKQFTYDYKFGVTTANEKAVTLSYFNMNSTVLPVPTREHFTFGGWYCEDKQVADSEGNLLEDYELLSCNSSELWAKWTANETFTYKILLIYVTEIDATLTALDKTKEIEVKYKMTDVERQICHNTTILLKRKLDDITDGLVEFQVDEYFTEMPVTTNDFKKDPGVGGYLRAWQIQEIVDKA